MRFGALTVERSPLFIARESLDRPENKDPSAIDRLYHPSFVMFSNGVTQDFEAFAASYDSICATPISYSVECDE